MLDANVLITANNTYYPIDAIPEFWDWLLHQSQMGRVKSPAEMMGEMDDNGRTPGRDRLCDWLRQAPVRAALLLKEKVDPALVRAVVDRAYARDLTEAEVDRIGNDPLLVAYALAARDHRTVVTVEVSAPAKTRANVKVPDACDRMGVNWCGPFSLYRRLGFTTTWRRPP